MNRGIFRALLGIAYFFDFHEWLALASHSFTHTNTHKSTFETHQNHGEISTDTHTNTPRADLIRENCNDEQSRVVL